VAPQLIVNNWNIPNGVSQNICRVRLPGRVATTSTARMG
jgi:hypothetical protein